MGIDIDKARIVFLPDESGVEHFVDFYTDLSKQAAEYLEDMVKLEFLRSVLKRLRTLDKKDLPKDSSTELTFNFEVEVDGESYSRPLEIVKKLGKSVVYELRIDISDFNWYFRATFFPKYQGGELYYCFVYPFVKIPGHEDPTDPFRDLTHSVYTDVISNPDKYFN
ncbi:MULTISPECIES: hypothetical protein [Bacillati]